MADIALQHLFLADFFGVYIAAYGDRNTDGPRRRRGNAGGVKLPLADASDNGQGISRCARRPGSFWQSALSMLDDIAHGGSYSL